MKEKDLFLGAAVQWNVGQYRRPAHLVSSFEFLACALILHLGIIVRRRILTLVNKDLSGGLEVMRVRMRIKGELIKQLA